VLLSWKESPHPPGQKTTVAGYCLYRSQKLDDLEKDPTCRKCQLLNQAPIAGTSCIDDLLQKKKTYYYVAMALDGNGGRSMPSNEATAYIDDKEAGSAANSPNPPLCRDWPAVKP